MGDLALDLELNKEKPGPVGPTYYSVSLNKLKPCLRTTSNTHNFRCLMHSKIVLQRSELMTETPNITLLHIFMFPDDGVRPWFTKEERKIMPENYYLFFLFYLMKRKML